MTTFPVDTQRRNTPSPRETPAAEPAPLRSLSQGSRRPEAPAAMPAGAGHAGFPAGPVTSFAPAPPAFPGEPAARRGPAYDTAGDWPAGATDTRPADQERFFFTAAGIRFAVVDFIAREKLSMPFQVDLSLALEEAYPVDEVLGAGGTLTIDLGENERYLNGIVNRFVQTGACGAFRLFKARLVPQMWLLGLEQDCRIFQDMTVLEIIRQVLESAGLPSDSYRFCTRNSYRQRPYCVQYRESHLDFLSRLTEEEGIYYYFEHTRRSHTIVFGEGSLAYQRLEGSDELRCQPENQMVSEAEVILELALVRQLQTNKVTLRDFDFKRPSLDMTTEAADQNGARSDEPRQRTHEWFDYPGRYTEPDLGRRFAAIRLQERFWNGQTVQGRSNCSRFLPGRIFAVDCHECDEANQEYTLLEVTHEGRQPQVLSEYSATGTGFSYVNRFTAIPAGVAYAPERQTPKPRIPGVQTARVTGPRHEAIYTDEYGRVKIRFHWDRSDSHDENASCWVRVSQLWAGANWGAMFIPRVGHEVIVEFEEGDPDRPIITGRVYNGAGMPPYTLPDEKSKSTIKSDSLSGHGFNELRFDDSGGEEEIFIHAQKDLNQDIENDMTTRVRHDQALTVENDRRRTVQHDETIVIEHDLSRTVNHDETVAIQGERSLQVGRNEQVTIQGGRLTRIQLDERHEVAANRTVSATGNQVLTATGNCLVESGARLTMTGNGGVTVSGPTVHLTGLEEIVLGVGANQIRITATGIEISGVMISTNAKTTNEIKGSLVKINC
jgi:type VI secretion system secreted protein VgrG